MLKTVIIGSGNVARHLAKAFCEAGLPPVDIYGRNEAAVKELATEVNVPFSTDELIDAELYLICTSDRAIAEVSTKIQNPRAVVAHTSGSLPTNILQGNYHKAAFYPLQTFSKDRILDYSEIPFFIEAEDPAVGEKLMKMASAISTRVSRADYNQRRHLHLAAVFACNFVNHLYAQAEKICELQQIPFQYLLPLIKETASKVENLLPKNAQTGPAVRNDRNVIEKHESLISDEMQLKMYRLLTESIYKTYEL